MFQRIILHHLLQETEYRFVHKPLLWYSLHVWQRYKRNTDLPHGHRSTPACQTGWHMAQEQTNCSTTCYKAGNMLSSGPSNSNALKTLTGYLILDDQEPVIHVSSHCCTPTFNSSCVLRHSSILWNLWNNFLRVPSPGSCDIAGVWVPVCFVLNYLSPILRIICETQAPQGCVLYQ